MDRMKLQKFNYKMNINVIINKILLWIQHKKNYI